MSPYNIKGIGLDETASTTGNLQLAVTFNHLCIWNLQVALFCQNTSQGCCSSTSMGKKLQASGTPGCWPGSTAVMAQRDKKKLPSMLDKDFPQNLPFTLIINGLCAAQVEALGSSK